MISRKLFNVLMNLALLTNEECRKKFLSAEIGAVTQQLMNKDAAFHTMEIEKYIRFSLRPRMKKYDEECKKIVQKSWGEFAVNVSRGAREIVTYGGPTAAATYFSGQVLPLPSMWQMMLIGGLVGLSKTLPDTVKSVVDIVANQIETKRNPLAFLRSIPQASPHFGGWKLCIFVHNAQIALQQRQLCRAL